MSEAKGLNRLSPLHRVMSGYGGNGYGGQGLLKTGMAGLVGAALAIGAAGLEGRLAPALGQDVAKIAYQLTNLSVYKVPDLQGLTPYETKWLDKLGSGTKQTRMDFYKINDTMVFTYSHNGKLFSVGMDFDWKSPVDVSLIDREGKGTFEQISADEKFAIPGWAR